MRPCGRAQPAQSTPQRPAPTSAPQAARRRPCGRRASAPGARAPRGCSRGATSGRRHGPRGPGSGSGSGYRCGCGGGGRGGRSSPASGSERSGTSERSERSESGTGNATRGGGCRGACRGTGTGTGTGDGRMTTTRRCWRAPRRRQRRRRRRRRTVRRCGQREGEGKRVLVYVCACEKAGRHVKTKGGITAAGKTRVPRTDGRRNCGRRLWGCQPRVPVRWRTPSHSPPRVLHRGRLRSLWGSWGKEEERE